MDKNIQLVPEQEHALKLMLDGNNIFLSGPAGTGKNVVIEKFKECSPKRIVSLSPTGQAALAIQGETIHGFFSFPIGPLLPTTILESIDFDNSTDDNLRTLLEAVDTIIIDEISLVRADLLDAIDLKLKTLASDANSRLPFGGKQLITSGDFFQLPPVVSSYEEWMYLKRTYGCPYAFMSRIWKEAGFKNIVLKHIHRQADRRFQDILNSIRVGPLSPHISDALNAINDYCCLGKVNKGVFICSTRALAEALNRRSIKEINEAEYELQPVITGHYPEQLYPASCPLTIRTGMRVMMLKNSRLPDGKLEYINGSMGTVTGHDLDPSTDPQEIIVALDSGNDVRVRSHAWKNLKYDISQDENDESRLTQKCIGQFTQFPIMPGYATTIHKAQGKTLGELNILLGERPCFAHGQLYTALSRAKSIEGITLDRPAIRKDIIVDMKVFYFYSFLNTESMPDDDDSE